LNFRRILVPVLALGVLALACFLLFEIALRLSGARYMSSLYVMDRERGWILRPHVDGWQTAEGLARVQTNSDNMRDVEYPVAKPPGTLRLAVLGDSFTEANQVDLDKTFVKQLQLRLATCPAVQGRRVEAMNFGIGGHGTGQQRMTYKSRAAKYQPDYVLLAFFSHNDPFDNHPWLSPSRPETAPRFALVNGTVTTTQPYADLSPWQWQKAETWDALRGLVNYSRVLQLAMHVQNIRRLRNQGVDNPRAVQTLGADYAEKLAFRPDLHPAVEEAWAVTEALLREFHRDVTRDGRQFRVVMLTAPAQVHPDAAERERYQQSIGAASLDYPERRLTAFAQKEGVALTALAPAMGERALRDHAFYHGFANMKLGAGHWNEAGHATAAELMARDVCADLGPPAR